MWPLTRESQPLAGDLWCYKFDSSSFPHQMETLSTAIAFHHDVVSVPVDDWSISVAKEKKGGLLPKWLLCSFREQKKMIQKEKIVPTAGIEPATFCLLGRRSTNELCGQMKPLWLATCFWETNFLYLFVVIETVRASSAKIAWHLCPHHTVNTPIAYS